MIRPEDLPKLTAEAAGALLKNQVQSGKWIPVDQSHDPIAMPEQEIKHFGPIQVTLNQQSAFFTFVHKGKQFSATINILGIEPAIINIPRGVEPE